jgi:hypothetical protein
VRNTILGAAVIIVAITGACQPKSSPADDALTSHQTSREPVRRVEVISRSSAGIADSIVGRKCRVQIRRDALGMAGNAPAVMAGRWANETSVEGTIVEMSDQWLIVQSSGKRVVVPHASILIIELQD